MTDVFDPNPYGPWKKRRMYYKGAMCGVMTCRACNKPIKRDEWYSVKRNLESEYSAHLHRSCSADDPQWVKIDAHLNALDEHAKAFKLACKEFAERWGVDDLNHYFED